MDCGWRVRRSIPRLRVLRRAALGRTRLHLVSCTPRCTPRRRKPGVALHPHRRPERGIIGRPVRAVMRRGRRTDGRIIECALCADPDEQNAGSRTGAGLSRRRDYRALASIGHRLGRSGRDFVCRLSGGVVSPCAVRALFESCSSVSFVLCSCLRPDRAGPFCRPLRTDPS